MNENLSAFVGKLIEKNEFDIAEELCLVMLEDDQLDIPARQCLANIYLKMGRVDLALDQANTCKMVAETTGNNLEMSLELIADLEKIQLEGAEAELQESFYEKETKRWANHIFSVEFTEKLTEIVGQIVSDKLDVQPRPPQYLRDIKYDLLTEYRSGFAAQVDFKLINSITFPDWWDHFRYCLSKVTIDGVYMEFGVWTGGTINFAAGELPEKIFHGFDSFEGLPDSWGLHEVGYLSLDGKPPEVADNVQLHIGYFEDTLPGFLEEHQSPAAFVHIDCDIYSSTVTVLEALKDRLRPGTVIVFDEYFDDEKKAFDEFVGRYDILYKYLCYSIASSSDIFKSGPEHPGPPYYYAPIYSVAVVIEGFVTTQDDVRQVSSLSLT